jgi:uncharacterized membrane protein YagU involved in acid resistance
MLSRTVIGFLVAPAVVPLGLLLTEWLHSEPITYSFGEVVFGFLIWYIYPLFFTLVFAVPLYLLLSRFNLVRWWTSLGAGLLIGAIGAMSINGQTQGFYTRLALLSGIAGLIFFFIAKYTPRAARS